MTTIALDQRNYRIGADNNADPDLCTWSASDNTPGSYPIGTKAMIRIQVAEDVGNSTANTYWSLYYNTVDNPDTATQVTSITNPKISDGTPTDGTATDTRICAEQAETWKNGLYSESDTTGKFALTGNYYTEFQFCIEFTSGATGTYYFYLFYNAAKLNGTYDNVVQITVATTETKEFTADAILAA